MFSRARRETGHGGPRVKSDRRRPSSKAVVGVEPLEGRMLLSYLVVVKNHKVIPVHGGDARVAEPLYSNGLAFKKQTHFYPVLHRAEDAQLGRGQCNRGGLRKSGHRWDPDLVRHRGRADHREPEDRLPGGDLHLRDRCRRCRENRAVPGPQSHPLRRRGRRQTVDFQGWRQLLLRAAKQRNYQ